MKFVEIKFRLFTNIYQKQGPRATRDRGLLNEVPINVRRECKKCCVSVHVRKIMTNPRLEEVKCVEIGKVLTWNLIPQSCCLCVKKLSGIFFLPIEYLENGHDPSQCSYHGGAELRRSEL